MSLDGDGNPSPWWTFAANEWLKPRIRKTDRVFEYGSGGSTLWLAAHAGSVLSVEHDKGWFEKIHRLVPSNAHVIHRDATDECSVNISAPYCRAIEEVDTQYDIIVIDGMERNACALLAQRMLSPHGIIIFDNSHRSKYAEGMKALAAAGFWRLDMAGCVWDKGVTSIFGHSTERWLSPSFMPQDYGT